MSSSSTTSLQISDRFGGVTCEIESVLLTQLFQQSRFFFFERLLKEIRKSLHVVGETSVRIDLLGFTTELTVSNSENKIRDVLRFLFHHRPQQDCHLIFRETCNLSISPLCSACLQCYLRACVVSFYQGADIGWTTRTA